MEPEISVSPEEAKTLIPELQQYGVCSRCVLRVIGVKNQWAYRQPDKALEAIRTDIIERNTTTAVDPKSKSDGNKEATPVKTDTHAEEDSSNSSNNQAALTEGKPEGSDGSGDAKHMSGEQVENMQQKDQQSSTICSLQNTKDVHMEDGQEIPMKEDEKQGASELEIKDGNSDIKDGKSDIKDGNSDIKDGKSDIKDRNSDIKDGKSEIMEGVQQSVSEKQEEHQQQQGVSDAMGEKSICGLCLGILQDLCEDDCAKRIGDQITDRCYQFHSFMMAVTLPLQLLMREHCLLMHMPEKLTHFKEIPSIKEVFKWIAGPMLGDALHVPFHPKSPFEVMVTMKHEESEREIELLLEKHGVISTANQPSRKYRGQPKKKRLRVYHAANIAPTRQQVSRAMSEMSHKLFKELFVCPPKCSSLPCSIEVMCYHGPIYIAGRYMKYSRHLSQSPWVVDGHRKTESSVEELICEYTKKMLNAEDYKFSSSGREDVDVRTLGRGRPFVVEFLNPRMDKLSIEELKKITQVVNSTTKGVKIRDLQMIAREDTTMLKEGEQEKTKSYSALVWVEKEIKEEDIKFLADIKDLTLHQKTPIRVLHRRPLATRDRVVHNMSYDFIDSHHFKLFMNTQAGTYIKEFVHGDFGRTLPNLGTLLKTDADILELDVMAVHVDWPPTIEDTD